MTKHEIYIRIDYEGDYRIENVSNALRIAFFKDEPYDKLSRRFKKFTHKPRYPEHEKYKGSDYNLFIVHKDYRIFNYIIHFYNPDKQIVSVDAYFTLEDKKNYQPLIFGFNDVDGNILYYTYNHLFKITYKWFFPAKHTGSLSLDGSFQQEDFETRLLEEYGLHESTRYNKFVIRLEKRTNETELKYPKTGKNKERVTVKKQELLNKTDFVKYEHAIDKSNNVESFYIGFYNNSLYMFDNHGLGKLQYVDAYYKKNDQLVLIVFKFQKGSKLYRCSEFLSDVNKTDPIRNISRLVTLDNQDIVSILIDESNKFKHEIEFRKGSRENIYISETIVCLQGTKFFSVLFTPNTFDGTEKGEKGSSIGPWVVYSGSLFKKNPDIKIDETSFKGIYNLSFTSIDVYYNDKNEPLFVVFAGGSGSKFFKRTTTQGNKWVEENKPSYVYDGTLSLQLQKISNPLFTNLGLLLEEKNQYSNTIIINGKNISSPISVSKHGNGPEHFKAEGYVCYEHMLFDYYVRPNTHGNFPKLMLEPTIGTIKIRLFGPHDKMSWPLTYTDPDYSTYTQNESVFVYFGKNNGFSNEVDNIDDSDTLPLLFCYNDKFYTPKSNDQYFGVWVDAGVTGSKNERDFASQQKRLKEALDRNFNMANEIDLTKTKSYGIPCCSKHPYYYKPDGFTTKRVHVTSYMNVHYTMYVHRAVFKNNIGTISQANSAYTFNSHTRDIKDKKINQIMVIYSGTSTNTNEPPVLVLLNEDGHSDGPGVGKDINESTTYGYYYQDKSKGAKTISYKFHHVKDGSKIMPKLMGFPVEGEGLPAVPDPKAIQPILKILESIGSTKMLATVNQDLPEIDTSDCKGPSVTNEIESLDMCEEFLGPDKMEEEEDDDEEEEDDDDDEEEDDDDEDEDEDQRLSLKDIRELTHSPEGLEFALREGYIGTLSGIDVSPGQEIDSRVKVPVDDRTTETVESRDGHLSTVDRPAAAAKPAAAKPAPARPPTAGIPEAGGSPTRDQPPSPSRTPTMESSSRTQTTSEATTHAQDPSRTSAQAPSSVSHTLTEPGETSKEVTKTTEPHLPERESQRQLSTPDTGQIDHDRAKLAQSMPTEENRNYIVVIFLDQQNQYEIRDFYYFFRSLDKFTIENVLNTKGEITVEPKEDSTWHLFKDGPYRVYEHDFNKSIRPVRHKRDPAEFKFIIKDASTRSFLTLYREKKKSNPSKLKYKSGQHYIHVYFARDRPKPLLFCCNGNLYRPVSHDDYDKSWSKLKSIKCPCSSVHGSTVQQVLPELKRVAELLQQVERSQTPTVHHHSSPQLQDAAQTGSSGPSTATIAGASVGSILTTAGVTAGATIATHPEWVIPVIRALV